MLRENFYFFQLEDFLETTFQKKNCYSSSLTNTEDQLHWIQVKTADLMLLMDFLIFRSK